jgi:hypothetical protein
MKNFSNSVYIIFATPKWKSIVELRNRWNLLSGKICQMYPIEGLLRMYRTLS